MLRPLPRGELLLHLNLSVSTTSLDLRHLDLFPRAMAELVLGTGVAEVHLSLARGRWLDSRWGAHPEPVPTGAAVWAWLPASTHQSGWGGLRRALSAVLCAGLQDDMDVEEDAEDVEEAAPDLDGAEEKEGKAPSATWGGEVDWRQMASPPAAVAPAPRVLRRAMTAREGVCTENLAALAQLWPCHDAAGVARLLAPDSPLRERLLRARHSSLRLRLLRTCAPDAHERGGAAGTRRGDARGDKGGGGRAGGGEVTKAAGPAEAAPPAAAAAAAGGCRPRLTLRLGLTALLAGTTAPDVIAAVAEPTAPEPAAAVVASATSATSAAARSAGGAARRGVRACPLCTSSWLQLQLPAGAAVHVVGSSGVHGGASRGEEDAAAAVAGGKEAATAMEAAETAAAAAAAAEAAEAAEAEARVRPSPMRWVRHVVAAPELQQLEWRLDPLQPAPALQLEWRRSELPRAASAPLLATRRVAGRELGSAALVTSLLSRSPHPIEVHGVVESLAHYIPPPVTSPHRLGCLDQLQARARARV